MGIEALGLRAKFTFKKSLMEIILDRTGQKILFFGVDDAEKLKLRNEMSYRHECLGEVTGTGSAVFDEIYEQKLTNPQAAAKISQKVLPGALIRADSAEPKSIKELKGLGLNVLGTMKGPDRVESCTIDKNGRVLSIKFRDMAVASTRGEQLERTVYFDEQCWSVLENGVQVSAGEHNLGEVPVVFFPSQKVKNGEINPTPELYPIAGIAKSLYNHCSWLTEILRNQTFPVLTFPSKEATDLVIGSNNALCYDGDTVKFQPGFISPPSDSAQMLQSQIKMLIEEMYRMAGLSFVTGTRQESSGIARQWEFERTNQRLSEFAKRCSMTERKMVMKVARWMGLDIDYTASYSSDFGVTDISTELKNAQAVLDMDLSPELRVEVAKQVMGSYLPELSAERFDEIVDSVGVQEQEPKYNEPPAGGEPNNPDEEPPEEDE